MIIYRLLSNSFRNTIKVSNNLVEFGPHLGPNCLQWSADKLADKQLTTAAHATKSYVLKVKKLDFAVSILTVFFYKYTAHNI